MAIALQPCFPVPDRSGQSVHTSRDEDGVVDIGWCEGVLADGRAFRAEMWAQEQVSMLTLFFSSVGLDDLDGAAMRRLVEAEGLARFKATEGGCTAVKVADDAGNALWSVNILVGTEDEESRLTGSVPLNPYSRTGEPRTMFNPTPIASLHLRSG